MKRIVMNLAMVVALSAAVSTTYATSAVLNGTGIEYGGGHKCNDKCKKDENGNCVKAKSEKKKKGKAQAQGKSCCKGGENSCHGKKDGQGPKSGQTAPKS